MLILYVKIIIRSAIWFLLDVLNFHLLAYSSVLVTSAGRKTFEYIIHSDKTSSQNIQYYTQQLEFGISVKARHLLDYCQTKPPLFIKYLRKTIRGPVLCLKSWRGLNSNLMTSPVILAHFPLEVYCSLNLWWSPALSAGRDVTAGV